MSGLVLGAVVGALFAIGTFLVLRRDLVQVVWGLAILSQSANVFLLSMGGLLDPTSDTVPVLAHHGEEAVRTTDPVVQALVLTAIVIGFGMTAFIAHLALRTAHETGSDHVDGREPAASDAREDAP